MALLHANATGFKPHQLKLILENQPNKRNCEFTQANFQEIYHFWLDNCVNSDESVYSLKRITKYYFLSNFQTLHSNITHPNLTEKKVQLKGGLKLIFTAPRMIYPDLSENCMQISTKYIHLSYCHSFPDTSLTTVSELQKKKRKVVYGSVA